MERKLSGNFAPVVEDIGDVRALTQGTTGWSLDGDLYMRGVKNELGTESFAPKTEIIGGLGALTLGTYGAVRDGGVGFIKGSGDPGIFNT